MVKFPAPEAGKEALTKLVDFFDAQHRRKDGEGSQRSESPNYWSV